jgi:hypothetical protein
MNRLKTALVILAALVVACSKPVEPISRPLPDRLELSAGTCPIVHCNRYQTDALPLSGPRLPSRVLSAAEIDHLWSSPIAGGILDYRYADGTTVFWVPQVDRIMKLRLNAQNQLEKLAELPLLPKKFPRIRPEQMQQVVDVLDSNALNSEAYDSLAAQWKGYQIEGLRAYYAMVNSEGILYVGHRDAVVAYGDAEPGKPQSAIVKLGQYGFDKSRLQLGMKMPTVVMIGLNMTHDGHIVAVTIDGTVIAITPDLSRAFYYTLTDQQIWNSIAVDEAGGVYVIGNRKLHKLVWTGAGFSDRAEDGAWVESYRIGDLDASLRAGRGSGTTPALMGAADDPDRFVAIADAANVNNFILYWRDQIPEDWQQLPGSSSRRVAAMLPVNFGDSALTSSYSENSATIFDYGAVLANNQASTGEKMTLDVQLKLRDPARTPYGVQKFQWHPASRKLQVAWIRADISSPNSTPVVAMDNRQLHVVGVKGGDWVMQALDWDSGETRAVYTLGASERYNPIMLALQLLPGGDPIYAGFAGVIHLRIGEGVD